MLIVTNFERFPEAWTSTNGASGRSVYAATAGEFARFGRAPDAVYVVNCDARILLDLVRRQLVGLLPRRQIIGVDMVLRQPRTARQRLMSAGKRLLFSRVDGFLHYFKDYSALHAIYGIGGDRAEFVNFKANLWKYRSDRPEPDGDYVICFGRSLRDFDSFFEAVERVGCPAVIVDPRVSLAWDNGSRFTRPLDALPSNVRVVSTGTADQEQARLLKRARVVVVPLLKGSLVAPISTLLDAMALGKCVIATEGPGVNDLFGEELLAVPPENVEALAAGIADAWTNSALRHRTAAAGWRYAQACGGEMELYQRVVDVVARRCGMPSPAGPRSVRTRLVPQHN